MKPISFIRADTCPVCDSKRSVDAYTNFDKPVGLTKYLDTKSSEDLKKRFIYYMECSKCHKRFFPIWIGNIPYASVDRDIDLFLSIYSQYKTVDP